MPILATLALAVTVTGYIPQHDVGAMMLPVLPGLTCAVSRDLAHLKGKWINVKGRGVRFVNDLTHKRLHRRVDLCVADMDAARDVNLQRSEITAISPGVYEKKVRPNAR